MQEITVIQGLEAEVVKLHIAACFERRAQALQVKLQHLWVEQIVVDPFFDELREVLRIVLAHVCVQDFFAQHFFGDGVHQQACSGVGVVGVFFDQSAGCQDGGLIDLVHGHAVIEVAHGLGKNRLGLHISAQSGAGIVDQALEVLQV